MLVIIVGCNPFVYEPFSFLRPGVKLEVNWLNYKLLQPDSSKHVQCCQSRGQTLIVVFVPLRELAD